MNITQLAIIANNVRKDSMGMPRMVAQMIANHVHVPEDLLAMLLTLLELVAQLGSRLC